MNVLIACECSGEVRQAFRALGHEAWSCDLEPAEDDSPHHYLGDCRDLFMEGEWDLLIAHPPCTRLANSGRRWLYVPPPGHTLEEMWADFEAGVELYLACRNAPIARKAIENPVMHDWAAARLGTPRRQIIQPWQFGEPLFKATGFELHNLPDLTPTLVLDVPRQDSAAYREGERLTRLGPSATRAKERSRTLPGIAKAMAEQWGSL